eukprot:scaffold8611_cov108-Isochrysis_galbana.AAC.8
MLALRLEKRCGCPSAAAPHKLTRRKALADRAVAVLRAPRRSGGSPSRVAWPRPRRNGGSRPTPAGAVAARPRLHGSQDGCCPMTARTDLWR